MDMLVNQNYIHMSHRFFSPTKSKTFAAIYLANGEVIYRSSCLNLDQKSKEHGMEQLIEKYVEGEYKGLFRYAVIYDNQTRKVINHWNQYGARIT